MSKRTRKPLLATIYKVSRDLGRQGSKSTLVEVIRVRDTAGRERFYFSVGIFFLFLLCSSTKNITTEKQIQVELYIP